MLCFDNLSLDKFCRSTLHFETVFVCDFLFAKLEYLLWGWVFTKPLGDGDGDGDGRHGIFHGRTDIVPVTFHLPGVK